MTDEQINIAIAEALGLLPTVGEAVVHLPDFCNDLNAIHDAILQLRKTGGQFAWLEYDMQLFKVLWGRKSDFSEATYYLGSAHSFDQVNATARQRAEAFLRTIRKWEEAPEITTSV